MRYNVQKGNFYPFQGSMMDRHGFRKSLAVDFDTIDDQLNSSDGDIDGFMFNEDNSWSKPRQKEIVPNIIPMFDEHKIYNGPPPQITPTVNKLTDEEYYLENFGTSSISSLPSHVEPIECAVINVAHLDQFPKAASPYSASLPCIFSWFDAHNSFSSEFPTAVQNYFKNAYSCFRPHLRFFFSIAPSIERFNILSSVRREVPTGRVLFHYIGYGFPNITEENIWCSERRSREFMPFPFDSLFERLQPPTIYLFDCNNASVVINNFKKASARLMLEQCGEGINWTDFLCICATSEGEELPDDPRLPRDFLTSSVLTPVKMAIICHMLQYYRLNFVSPSVPIEPPCEHLWNEKYPEASRLNLALTAITDSIAADSLSKDLYHRIFRNDRLSAVLFRNFILSQYLLRPYRVHPKSFPELPDLSMHNMWRQWSILLDTAICTTSIQRPSLSLDLFERATKSFEVLMHNDQFHLIRPYHLTLLFHMLYCEQENDKPIILLSEYSADPRANVKMLSSTSVFHPLFSKLIMSEPNSPVFTPLLYLVLTLLFYNPSFANEIRKDLDASNIPKYIFDKSIPEQTRVACGALVATLVVSHEKFQQICTSTNYLNIIHDELRYATPYRSLWMFLTIRRAFNLYSPDPSTFTQNALHLQTSLYTRSDSSIVRAAATSVLACFMRPFECICNAQLFYMSLCVICDPSFIVRFHLVLLLKKFIMSFDSFSEAVLTQFNFTNSTFISTLTSIFQTELEITDKSPITEFKSKFFEHVDERMAKDNYSGHAYASALYLLEYFAHDPHPSVGTLAQTVLQFVNKQRAAFETMPDDTCSSNLSQPSSINRGMSQDNQFIVMSYGDEEFEEEHLSFANLDQNESLHQISLHNLLTNRQEKLIPNKTQVTDYSKAENFRIKLTDEPLKHVDFERESLSIVAATSNQIFFLDDKKNLSKLETTHQIVDLKLMRWHKKGIQVLFTTIDGCVHKWLPPKKTLELSFRANPKYDVFGGIYANFLPADTIITITENGSVCQWNLMYERLLNEWPKTVDNIISTTVHGKTCSMACMNGMVYEMNIETGKIFDTLHLRSASKLAFDGEHVWCGTESGGCDCYIDGKWKTIYEEKDGNLKGFAVNDYVVLCLENKPPLLIDKSTGELIRSLDNIEKGSVCAAHSKIPMFAFATNSGELIVESH